MKVLIALLLVAMVAAGCGAGTPVADTETPSTTTEDDNHDEDGDEDGDDHDEGYTFGEPAEAAEADRTIEITANDDFTFDPASMEVSAGEVVTFRITNAGVLPHDFTLGDEDTQVEHEAEMAEMGGEEMHGDPNAVSVEAGETVELTWRFGETMTILYGCHVPGHYAAGMKGELTIGS